MNGAASGRPVAVVTGGRRGIGRAVAYALAQAGYNLVLNDRIHDEALQETLAGIQAHGAQVEFVPGDIAHLPVHKQMVDTAYGAFGRLDSLINNAGIQVRERGDLLDVTPERFDEIIGVNLRGNFFLTQRVARRMLADGATAHGPMRSIVIVSSSNAHLVSVEKGEYCISNTGLSMMTKLYALRLAEAGIAVFEIQPGLIRTDMTAEVREKYGALIEHGASPIRRWGEPDDIGRAVATLVTGQIPFATGISLGIDGGLMIPRL